MAKRKPKMTGVFTFEAFDVDGTPLWTEKIPNGRTTVGLNKILDVMFGAATQLTTWYLGLINNSGFTGLSAGDTMSSHAGWSELTGYSESTRQAWTPGSASSGSITNPTAATFTANATISVNGAFLVSSSTKGGTSGTLFSTGSFTAVRSLTSGQTCKVTYTATIA